MCVNKLHMTNTAPVSWVVVGASSHGQSREKSQKLLKKKMGQKRDFSSSKSRKVFSGMIGDLSLGINLGLGPAPVGKRVRS